MAVGGEQLIIAWYPCNRGQKISAYTLCTLNLSVEDLEHFYWHRIRKAPLQEGIEEIYFTLSLCVYVHIKI